jgi:chromate reductase
MDPANTENPMTYRIAVVIGSLRRDSFNRQLANALAKLAPAGFEFVPVRIDDLPLYDQDDDSHQAEPVRRLKTEIAGAQGVLFVTPEYNRSIPGVLKNAIDNASRPYGQSAWAGKPAGVVGISVGAIGTALAQQHLRNVLAYLDMPTLGQPEVFLQNKPGFFADDGSIAAEGTREFLQKFLERFTCFVKEHADAVANR